MSAWKPPQGGSLLAGPGFAQQFAYDDAAGMTPGNVQGFGNLLNWSQIPGTSGLLRDGEFGDLPTVDNAALDEWLSSNGYKIMDSPADGQRIGYRWIQDAQGNVIGEPTAYEKGTDKRFLAAGAAAMGITGANVLAAGFGASGAGAGAAASGGGAAPSTGGIGTITNTLPAAPAMGTPLPAGGGLLAAAPTVPAAASVPALTGAAAAGAMPSWLPSGLAPAWDFIKQNPKLVGALAGGLVGGASGGAGGGADTPAAYTGPMPTITRGQWSATPTGYDPSKLAPGGGGLLGVKTTGAGLGRYMGLLGG